jgi:hypothetical protein
MTFTSLQDDMRRYLEAGFTETSDPLVYKQIPRLINLAEQRIAREIKVQQFIRPVTFVTTPGIDAYQKPDRWRDTISMMINGDNINARSYEYVRKTYPQSVTGQPIMYADYSYGFWLLAPMPDIAYTIEVLYYERPESLSDSNQTNIMTIDMPDLLLYGALLEATPFLKDDARIQTWMGLYDRASQALVAQDQGKVLDRAAQRQGA